MTASDASAPNPGWHSSRVIRQPIPGRPLQEIFCKGLRLPRRWVHPAIRAAKIAGNPAQYRLRRRLADERNVPAYVIFSDATLLAMTEAHPQTEAELLSISGVGPKKLETFGDAFLEAIRSASDAEQD